MSEQFSYNLERAQKEASKMQEKIRSGEAKDYKEAEKLVDGIKHPEKKEDENLVEKELSPEQIEKIMEKVQDINKYGTAYRKISNFNTVKYNGYIDTTPLKGGFYGVSRVFGMWPKESNKPEFKPKSVIFFHIRGRTMGVPYDNDSFDFRIGNSYTPNEKLGDVSFIFSLDGYKEVLGGEDDFDSIEKYNSLGFPTHYGLRHGEYSLNRFYRGLDIPDEILRKYKPHEEISEEDKKKIKAYDDEGFVITDRVPPDKFRGIVIGTGKSKEEMEQEGQPNLEKECNILNINTLAKRIKDDFEEEKKDHPLLPIYDVHGNLLWPRMMKYSEVKKFVEERDKEKDNNEEREK